MDEFLQKKLKKVIKITEKLNLLKNTNGKIFSECLKIQSTLENMAIAQHISKKDFMLMKKIINNSISSIREIAPVALPKSYREQLKEIKMLIQEFYEMLDNKNTNHENIK
ncbi:MAG: hypothetical protein IKM43_00945 [Clostridia bacterium]|nr:hypothetical protein [Clostridia bacterium]